MADGILAADDDSDLERSINCPICFEYMRDSRTLYPCVHTFCTDCVDRLDRISQKGKTGIECPLCRGFVVLSEIRRNRLMNVLIKLVTENESGSGSPQLGEHNEEDSQDDVEGPGLMSGAACIQCDSPQVSSRCRTCSIDLCQKCHKGHRRIPGFQEHRVIFLSIRRPRRLSSLDVVVQCTKHPEQEINANCKTCNFTICSECKDGEHAHHQFESLGVALKRYRLLLKSSLKNISKKCESKRKTMKELETQKVLVQENQVAVQADLHDYTEQVKLELKNIESRISNGFEYMEGQLKGNAEMQIKEMDSKLQELELSLKSDESIKAWTETIAANTDGGGLLAELQSGLINKLHEIQKQAEPSSHNVKLYKFVPQPNVVDVLRKVQCGEVVDASTVRQKRSMCDSPMRGSVDNLDTAVRDLEMRHSLLTNSLHTLGLTSLRSSDSQRTSAEAASHFPSAPPFGSAAGYASQQPQQDPVMAALATAADSPDLRTMPCENIISTTLVTEEGSRISRHDLLNVRAKCHRLCVQDGKVWVPCPKEGGIMVFDPARKVAKSIAIRQVNSPCALHPFQNGQFLLASASGLYIINQAGSVRRCVHSDMFNDVCVKDGVVYGLTRNKVMYWNSTLTRYDWFRISVGMGTSTLCVHKPYIYVCEYLCHLVHKYSDRGQYIETFGSRECDRGELLNTYICGSDRVGNTLIASGNGLKVLSTDGQWHPLSIQVNSPVDAMLLGTSLFVLQEGGNNGRMLSVYHMGTL